MFIGSQWISQVPWVSSFQFAGVQTAFDWKFPRSCWAEPFFKRWGKGLVPGWPGPMATLLRKVPNLCRDAAHFSLLTTMSVGGKVFSDDEFAWDSRG